MFSRRVKSILLIDYENISGYCPVDKIQNWMDWLERGRFDDDAAQRRFVEKRVYLNWSQQRFKEAFEARGFLVVMCEKLTQEKNGLDIRVAMDVSERLVKQVPADEYVVLAMDSDYVPVLERIEQFDKKSVILADENRQNTYSAFKQVADIIIPTRVMKEAASFSEERSWWQRAREWAFGTSASQPGTSSAANPPAPKPAAPQLPLPPPAPSPSSAPPPVEQPSRGAMDAAVRAVLRSTRAKPYQYTANKNIEAELTKRVRGFSKSGKGGYLGYESFKALLTEIEAEADGRIEVSETKQGGVSVRYIPKKEE